MARVSRPKNESAAFSSLWRRQPRKRPLAAAELSTPICRTLVGAIAGHVPLTIQLRPAEGHQIESKAFFPLEIFARGTHVFLDCRSYPEGEDCTLRLDQIVGAQCEVVSGASETADSWKSRNWSQAAGRYRAWERPPSPKRRGVDRGLRLRLSAYLAAGGTTLGWLILFRRALGY